MLKTKKRGQSTLEYIVLVTAVIAALILFLGPTGIFRKTLNGTVGKVANDMDNMADRIVASRPLSNP